MSNAGGCGLAHTAAMTTKPRGNPKPDPVAMELAMASLMKVTGH
jgi:hypothetical protein